MKNKKILITGSSGFLGKHLTRFFTKKDFIVIPLTKKDCDLLDYHSTKSYIQEKNPDFIIHLASRVSPGRNTSDFDEQIKNTILPSINVANSLTKNTVLCIFVGSIEEYGSNPPPFTEDLFPIPISTYGWAKIASHSAVKYISKQNEIPICWVRPSLIFGSGASEKLFFGHVFKGCLRNEVVNLTKGEQTRDFIYVKDVCEHFLRLIKNPELARNQVLNISSGDFIQLKNMALLIKNIIGKGTLNIGSLPYRDNEVMNFYSSNQKFSSIFGKIELTPLELALKETLREELNHS